MRSQLSLETILTIGFLLILLTASLAVIQNIKTNVDGEWMGRASLITLLGLKSAMENACPHQGYIRYFVKTPPDCTLDLQSHYLIAHCPYGDVVVPLNVSVSGSIPRSKMVTIKGGATCTVS